MKGGNDDRKYTKQEALPFTLYGPLCGADLYRVHLAGFICLTDIGECLYCAWGLQYINGQITNFLPSQAQHCSWERKTTNNKHKI